MKGVWKSAGFIFVFVNFYLKTAGEIGMRATFSLKLYADCFGIYAIAEDRFGQSSWTLVIANFGNKPVN